MKYYKSSNQGGQMIDDDGYRPNVGIVIRNLDGSVLWAKRNGQHFWQFPQGGINAGETTEQAMYRELFEEIGLSNKDVCILASTQSWLRYKLPKRLVRLDSKPVCIGQKQKWFLLQLLCSDADINTQRHGTPEFDGWQWVMKEFSCVDMPQQETLAQYSISAQIAKRS